MTDKKWVQRGGGTFFKWDTPGTSIEGVWQGRSKGKFESGVGTVETGNGPVSFSYLTVLEQSLSSVPVGTEIKIVYNGVRLNPNTGREFKAFDVFTMGAAGTDPDSDVPF